MHTIGVIGGSGLYHIEGLKGVESIHLSTPFGEPSDSIVKGQLNDATLLFLPRHGQNHEIAPHLINYRANIFVLKQLGAQQIVSFSAVGSLRESIHPGDFVLVDQYIDRTRSRINTFFEEHGIVTHVSFADPTDPALVNALFQASQETGIRTRKGGTYVCIEGPQFSTRAESLLYRSWNADIVGMTNLPEARLAREAEMPYASVAMVTDYDCWHESEEDVSVEVVIKVLNKNADSARKIIRKVIEKLPDPEKSPAFSALKNAMITSPESISSKKRELLSTLIGKYFPALKE